MTECPINHHGGPGTPRDECPETGAAALRQRPRKAYAGQSLPVPFVLGDDASN